MNMKRGIILGVLLLSFLAGAAWAIDFYSIKKTNLTTSSVNLDFGFPAAIVILETPTANTQEICIDWAGGTAVCPSTDAAGDDRLGAGKSLTVDLSNRGIGMDNYKVTSISVIAVSGTQTISVRAFR
jgi:hypothetical protein